MNRNRSDINRDINIILDKAKMTNRIPQHLELSRPSRIRLIDAIANMEEFKATNEYIAGFVTGYIIGFGDLFDQMTAAFEKGMIKRVR